MANDGVRVVIDFADPAGIVDRLVFRSPERIIEARLDSQVIEALALAESVALGGQYVAGFVSYEAAGAFDSALSAKPARDFPLVWFAVFDSPSQPEERDTAACPCSLNWTPDVSQDEYRAAVDRVQNAIRAGETYQANYTFRLRAKFECEPLAYYNHLLSTHPVPCAAFIDTGRFAIISNSPEIFLSIEDGVVTSRPMKGTAPRGRYQAEDHVERDRLLASDKEQAEHVMIVDLVRSDLGRVAEVGSVTVADMFEPRPLPTVWQTTSTVRCTPVAGTSLVDLFRAAFPAGSVTGAPKPRTMRLIAELESSPRNVYCGAIGFLKPGGNGAFSVPIRTIAVDLASGAAECGVGSGITSGSSAASEYAEALAKSHFLDAPDRSFALLEAMLLEDGRLASLERHLQRLSRTADYFGRRLNEDAVRRVVKQHAQEQPHGRRKLRLVVHADGALQVTSTPIVPIGRQKAALAEAPIDVRTPFVFHKTSRRQHYDRFKCAYPLAFDVLLWNEQSELTEFTTGNVVVQLAGVRCTPPVRCGLLAGVLRETLLDSGEIVEQVVTVSELAAAEAIWFINSVRGWVRVDLASSRTGVPSANAVEALQQVDRIPSSHRHAG